MEQQRQIINSAKQNKKTIKIILKDIIKNIRIYAIGNSE
jgi:hypothetical protein